MEVLFAFLILYGVCWASYKALVSTANGLLAFRQRCRNFRANQNSIEANRIQQERASLARHASDQKAIRVNREMQQAVLHLAAAPDPDFRRAAASAREAECVPEVFRRRQFLRLRTYLVRHFATCLQRGTDPEVLFGSLVELTTAFGMPDFEADYIRQENERLRISSGGPDSDMAVSQFQSRLGQLQRVHDQRLEIIRAMPNLSDDVRAQLVEAEESRFQSQLFGRSL